MTLLGDGCYMFLEEGICNPIDFVKMAMLQMILRRQQNITFKIQLDRVPSTYDV